MLSTAVTGFPIKNGLLIFCTTDRPVWEEGMKPVGMRGLVEAQRLVGTDGPLDAEELAGTKELADTKELMDVEKAVVICYKYQY